MSTESSPTPQEKPPQKNTVSGEPLTIDGISYIPSDVLLRGIRKLSFKDNRCFGVLDQKGEAPRAYTDRSELGVYFNDTRYLSFWDLHINSMSLTPLAQELRFGGSTLVLSMTNPDLPSTSDSRRIPRDTFLIRRVLTIVEDVLYEALVIRNFDSQAHTLQIEQGAGTAFHDIFEVRGFQRKRRGEIFHPEEHPWNSGSRTCFQYKGLDGTRRSLHWQRGYPSEKVQSSKNRVSHSTEVTVGSKSDIVLHSVISFDQVHSGEIRGKDFNALSVPELMQLLGQRASVNLIHGVQIRTQNEIIDRAIVNAQVDIQMLLTEEGDLLYPYAGLPWFSAPFGRDGLITAYQCLPWYPDLAKGVLKFAFRWLGEKSDPFTEEQPGKVFHELRRGEMALTREVPFIPYYGSVDSTPLCLILLHEYMRWVPDLKLLKEWWPAALQAMEWIDQWGDPSQTGFVEYAMQAPTGLINQGWKDSTDSVMHSDGQLASSPIRLCEVQAYAYRARIAMSELARFQGQEELALRFRENAIHLQNRFLERYWDNERKYIYLALDGDLNACKVLSSNMGHCLWGQILPPHHAEFVTQHLMGSHLFSGFGIRTLADTEQSYNPLSYHNGSIWPHDNSLILEGFRMYGHHASLEKLSLALIEVLEATDDFRLPELYCGFRKRGKEPPIPYEVACKPQAWAAGSVFLMLKSLLGITRELGQNAILFHPPVLTSRLPRIEVKDLSGPDWRLGFRIKQTREGNHLNILTKEGNLRVMTVH